MLSRVRWSAILASTSEPTSWVKLSLSLLFFLNPGWTCDCFNQQNTVVAVCWFQSLGCSLEDSVSYNFGSPELAQNESGSAAAQDLPTERGPKTPRGLKLSHPARSPTNQPGERSHTATISKNSGRDAQLRPWAIKELQQSFMLRDYKILG